MGASMRVEVAPAELQRRIMIDGIYRQEGLDSKFVLAFFA